MSQPKDDTADSGTREPDLDVITEQAARIAELEDLRLRALADLDNVRKRCAAQVSRAEAEARAAVARQWLAVVDNLDLALEHAEADPVTIIERGPGGPGSGPGRAGPPGLPAPRRPRRQVRPGPARGGGLPAGPGAEADVVAEVVRPAYGEGDHQLRPAQVVVARPD